MEKRRLLFLSLITSQLNDIWCVHVTFPNSRCLSSKASYWLPKQVHLTTCQFLSQNLNLPVLQITSEAGDRVSCNLCEFEDLADSGDTSAYCWQDGPPRPKTTCDSLNYVNKYGGLCLSCTGTSNNNPCNKMFDGSPDLYQSSALHFPNVNITFLSPIVIRSVTMVPQSGSELNCHRLHNVNITIGNRNIRKFCAFHPGFKSMESCLGIRLTLTCREPVMTSFLSMVMTKALADCAPGYWCTGYMGIPFLAIIEMTFND